VEQQIACRCGKVAKSKGMGDGQEVWREVKEWCGRHWCWFVIGGMGFAGLVGLLAYAYGSSLGVCANGSCNPRITHGS